MTARHVLIVRTDSDGDVLLAGPAVRRAARHAQVSLLVSPAGAAAARLLPGPRTPDDVIVADVPWSGYRPPDLDAAATLRLVADLAARDIDAAIVLTSFHQSPLPAALLLRLAGVAWIGGASTDYPGSLLDLRLPGVDEADPRHEVTRQLATVDAALAALDLTTAETDARAGRETGTPTGPRDPLEQDDDARLALRRPLPALPPQVAHLGRYVVVHPGASVPARAPRPDDAAAHVAALASRGHPVVVTGGPAEKALTSQIASLAGALARSRTSPIVDLGGATDLPGLAAVLAGADAVVVGNTGPAHLAAAVGTPVVSLFSPVVKVDWWRPWGVPHVVLGDQDAACAGTRARHCPLGGHPCLSGIAPADVADSVEAVEALARPERRVVAPRMPTLRGAAR